MVSSHWFSSSMVSLACITSICSIHCFPGGHSLHLAFGSFFYKHPLPRPLYFPLINQCDRCLVPLVRGLMAGGHRFASHGGTTLSRGPAVPKREVPRHPRHPPTLSNTIVNIYSRIFLMCFSLTADSILLTALAIAST